MGYFIAADSPTPAQTILVGSPFMVKVLGAKTAEEANQALAEMKQHQAEMQALDDLHLEWVAGFMHEIQMEHPNHTIAQALPWAIDGGWLPGTVAELRDSIAKDIHRKIGRLYALLLSDSLPCSGQAQD